MTRACDSTPPTLLLQGIAEFNRGEYFECHETLEHIWMREPGQIRRLYQGILQVGVGLYHLGNGNYRGTLNLLGSAIGYLHDFSPQCMGIDVSALIEFAATLRRRVEEAGSEHFRALVFDRPQIAVDPQVAALVAADVEPGMPEEDSPGHW